MHRALWSSLIIALLLGGLSAMLCAQSQRGEPLGDIARANRAQQQAQQASGATPKVITNQDLPPGSTPVPQSSTSDSMTMVSGVKRSNPYADQQLSDRLMGEQRASGQWKARIQEQETRVAELQARIDRASAIVHNSASTGQYGNRYQAMQMQRLSQMQERLEEQKQRLAMMQDAVRHSGMGQ
jgi:hypothetical protein